jgi:hypothetical protein
MAVASYGGSSPWKNTKLANAQYLDVLNIRPVPAEADDVLYEIETQYTHRPDLLSYDLYGTPKLWWVFAQRNMDVIKDPIFDMVPGTKIFLPKGPKLKDMLGI